MNLLTRLGLDASGAPVTFDPMVDGRVLVLAPTPRAAAATLRRLRAIGITPVLCERMADLLTQLGADTALVVLTGLDDSADDALHVLAEVLLHQLAWSEIPVIAMARAPGAFNRKAGPRQLPGAVLLDWPPDKRVFLGVVSRCLRSRRRQYALREQMARIAHANQELGDVVQAKDDFMATLAHELRNPLNALAGAARLLSARDAATTQLASGVVTRQVEQMSRLLDDLSDVARVTRHRLELRKEKASLAAIIHSAVESTQTLMEAKQHRVHVELPAEPIEIVADPARISQVVSNLLANSAKYTEHAGEIHLQVRREGAEVAISVRDNGIGIAPESIHDIFGMFTQLKPALERSRGGLGIGLALVKGIVELHRGRVHASSPGVGLGSEFTAHLPLDGESMEYAVRRAATAALSRVARSILLADDNLDELEVLAALLRIEGHTVHLARDGIEALRLAAERGPDVLVLDIDMPGMSGYEVARQLHANGVLRPAMKLIALSGWAQSADKRSALEAGFDHHLTKPLDVNQLLEVLG